VLCNTDLNALNSCNFIGISLDSSTDISSKENLVITVKFVNKAGETEEKFLKLLELKSKKSEILMETVKNFLFGLRIGHKLGSIATDGGMYDL
jgi:hypothetical protein